MQIVEGRISTAAKKIPVELCAAYLQRDNRQIVSVTRSDIHQENNTTPLLQTQTESNSLSSDFLSNCEKTRVEFKSASELKMEHD